MTLVRDATEALVGADAQVDALSKADVLIHTTHCPSADVSVGLVSDVIAVEAVLKTVVWTLSYGLPTVQQFRNVIMAVTMWSVFAAITGAAIVLDVARHQNTASWEPVAVTAVEICTNPLAVVSVGAFASASITRMPMSLMT